MKTYKVETYVEDGWIMVAVPELDLLTQAEHPGEVELMAKDIIALELDIEVEDVQVEVHPDAAVHRWANQFHAERLKAEIDQLGDRGAE